MILSVFASVKGSLLVKFTEVREMALSVKKGPK